MNNKDLKRCLASLAFRDIQIKDAMRRYFILSSLAMIIKKLREFQMLLRV
jgi:hypothetical protein